METLEVRKVSEISQKKFMFGCAGKVVDLIKTKCDEGAEETDFLPFLK